jgi:hypothetical protein
VTSFTFNVAKGKVNYYATLPGTNDAIVAVPLETTDLEPDETLMDKTTLAAILAGSSNEQTTMGRVELTGVAVSQDSTENTGTADADDFTYTGASGSPIAAFVLCYVPDNTSPDDSTTIPLTKHDFSAIPNGSDLPVQVSSFGFFVAADDV